MNSILIFLTNFALTQFREWLCSTCGDRSTGCYCTEEVIQKAFGTRWFWHCQN